MKKSRKIFYIAAAICIAVGLALCTTAFAVVRGDFSKLSTTSPYEEKSVSYAVGELAGITLLDRNTSVRLERSTDSEIHVTYFENAREEYRLSTSGGELRMEKVELNRWFDFIGINFNFQDTSVVIAVPEDYKGWISLGTTNASLIASDLNLSGDLSLTSTNNAIRVTSVACIGHLKVETTNGGIDLVEVEAASIEGKSSNHSVVASQVKTTGDFILTTTNGGVDLDDVTAADLAVQSSNHALCAKAVITQGRLEMRTTNGSIGVENVLPGQAVELVTTNSAIRGTILDRLEQYTIDSSTTNANKNLPDQYRAGPKSLIARTTNGKIEIDFVG